MFPSGPCDVLWHLFGRLHFQQLLLLLLIHVPPSEIGTGVGLGGMAVVVTLPLGNKSLFTPSFN